MLCYVQSEELVRYNSTMQKTCQP